jgi:uncharacterized protein YlaI
MAAKRQLGFEYTCQKCRKRVDSTRRREIHAKDYVGPCDDSFCYASCDLPSCRPINVTVCEQCAKELSK